MQNNWFVCGRCKNNDYGFCDFIGVLVEDDDPPHCNYGSGWEEKENVSKGKSELQDRHHRSVG